MTYEQNQLQTHLYSVQLGTWAASPGSADSGFLRLYATSTGLKLIDSSGSELPLVTAIEQSATIGKDGLAGVTLSLNANYSQYKTLQLASQSKARFSVYVDNGNDNAGSDANGNLNISRYHDDGSFSSVCIQINRATGAIDLLGDSVKVWGKSGFNNTTPISKPTVTGSRGGNAALASLLTALANYGLITNSTS